MAQTSILGVENEAFSVVDALGAAIFARDITAIRALYADDITVWHASTDQVQTKEENLALLAGVFKMTSRLEYIRIKRHSTASGVVQQHCLVGMFDDGRPLPELNACLVIGVSDGKIVRIDEYFDGSAYAEVWQRLAAVGDT